ncbi:hypothetical protein LJC63_13120 [Ruminococcaceae bacterium OttesenSCG-928-L11]|nr:hypothetical protein [Ruminococcaceae bacterium OttesenSCG-928-L11]
MWGLLAVLCLTGCTQSASVEPAATVELSEIAIPLDSPREDASYILVEHGVDETVKAAAEAFAQDLERQTGGAYLVRETEYILRDLSDEGVHFAFLDGEDYRTWCDAFRPLSRPFLYTGYNHFTMSVNSEKVMSYVRAEMRTKGAVPVAAFYLGSDVLVSDVNLYDYTSFAGAIIDGDDAPIPETIPTLLMNGDSYTRWYAYDKAGSFVQVELDAAARAQALQTGEAEIAEFAAGDLALLELESTEGLNLYRTVQHVHTVWLTANPAFYESLSGKPLAAVQEAIAGIYPRIDYVVLEQEGDVLDHVWREPDSGDLTKTRQALYRSAASLEPALSREETEAVTYIREIGSAMKEG